MASSTAAPIILNATISSTDRIARAHQTPFCARGLQKIIAVSENAPGAHGDVPRAGGCSTVRKRGSRGRRPKVRESRHKQASRQAGKQANQAGKAKMTGQPSNRALLLTSQDSRAGHPRSGYTKQVQESPAKAAQQPGKISHKQGKTRRAGQATIKAGRRYFFRWPLWSLQRP